MSTKKPQDVLNTINLVTQCLCIPVITFFVLARFSIRAYYKQWVPIEDWSCLVAWLLFMAYCGIAIVLGQQGGGYPSADASAQELLLFRKFTYISTVLYCPMALLVKVVLLSILTRIFAPFKNKIFFIYVFLGGLIIYYIIAEIVKIRICVPVSTYWTLDPKGSCLNQRASLLADSVISFVTDLLILILPLPLTWSLQMSVEKKLRVIGMLSAGGLATAFSIYRLIIVLNIGEAPDVTLLFIRIILSGNAEGGLGLICACLPTINIVIRKVRDNSYKPDRYYNQEGSSVHLSHVKGPAGPFSMIASRQELEPHEFGSDQSHLITFAGAVDMNHSTGRKGIQKTVDVQQTVEVMDSSEPSPRY